MEYAVCLVTRQTQCTLWAHWTATQAVAFETLAVLHLGVLPHYQTSIAEMSVTDWTACSWFDVMAAVLKVVSDGSFTGRAWFGALTQLLRRLHVHARPLLLGYCAEMTQIANQYVAVMTISVPIGTFDEFRGVV